MNAPPSSNSSDSKKGLSGLAIAGIGCGGLLLLVLVAGFLLMGRACSKLKDIAGDVQKNPARAGVMLALKMNPEIEVISTDDSKSEVTFKEKKTGKVTTMSFDDVAQGKFKIKTDGQEVVFDGSSMTKDGKISMKDEKGNEVTIKGGGGGGIVHTKGPDGEMTIGGASSVPSWVPAYPGAKALEGGMKIEKADETSGMAVAETADPVGKVKEFYESKLKAAGYKVEVTTTSADGKDTVMLSSNKDDGKSTISAVITTEEGKTRLMLNYQDKK